MLTVIMTLEPEVSVAVKPIFLRVVLLPYLHLFCMIGTAVKIFLCWCSVGNGGIHIGINYSVLNETKRHK
jgi:hypothetical protein